MDNHSLPDLPECPPQHISQEIFRHISPRFSPRIYCLDPVLVEPAEWDDLLAHCAAMAFDHVLLCGDHCIAELARSDSDQAGTARLAELAKLCKRHDLHLLMDLSPTRFRADDPVLLEHEAWFAKPVNTQDATSSDPAGLSNSLSDPLPDPRFPHRLIAADGFVTRTPCLDMPGVVDSFLDWWSARLTYLLQAGVAGFRCLEPASLPVQVWRHLMKSARKQQPDSRFLAWTPGCTHDQLDQLVGSGFDGVFSSGAWWDFRAPWYFREYHKLATIAPVLTFPEDPSGPRLARALGLRDLHTRRLGALRALHFATVSGAGWMMPMGFELGLTEALSVARLAGSATRLTTPEAYKRACANADADFRPLVTEANRAMAQESEAHPRQHGASSSWGLSLLPLSAADSPWLLMERQGATPEHNLLIAINPALDHAVKVHDDGWHQRLRGAAVPHTEEEIVLAPGAVKVLPLAPLSVVPGHLDQTRPAPREMRDRRIAIERVSPAVDEGSFAAKRVVGEHFIVGADIFMDGHDHLAAEVLVRAADETQWRRIPMQLDVNDRWFARVALTRMGRHYFCIEAWSDEFETFHDGLQKKRAAGQDVSLELEEGRLLIAKLARDAAQQNMEPAVLEASAALLHELATAPNGRSRSRSTATQPDTDRRLALLCAQGTRELVRQLTARSGTRAFLARSPVEYPVEAERAAARFASWYELFPRSQSGSAEVHGTFDDVIARLPAIRAMGFDTLYFPPIHPIGKAHRKGKNNSVTAGPDDPGSPYAIGSEEGGHDAIHPQLGTLDDFLRLRDAAAGHGLELALDFAIQCSPDHPWLKQHPGWFAWRPDGSMRYAENPPKKYQDIVNVDFYAQDAIPDLWLALRDIVVFWVQQGVNVFRVDNPHTKPFPFWEWMIASVRSRYPQVIFLSEAFTRPKPMYRLAKAGFSQSYTYFTWRQGKQELIDYLRELTNDRGEATQPRDFYRPHFFVNTPDINPTFLQHSGRAGFQIRAALAATLSGLWGVYSGFELCEASAVPGKEEYLDSEKYEIRSWDWQRPGNIIDDITRLNRIRIENPALQTHLGVQFLPVNNDHILCFVKSTPAMPSAASSAEDAQRFGDNTVLVAINLDPFQSRQGDIDMPLAGFGIADRGEQAQLQVEDLLNEQRFAWIGTHQSVVLDPRERPYRIWRIRAGET
ncbi:alpha-1,4-glucan--maltose-1-phosphate maltosyltransferase [Herbaspirillum frisingense]|uniref:alpha-1,4-glucan--maltose-1-phosphate maltosyltransferase n=1 Tax=Herbaspirillum frisingense TaxID=92645 RepID=UPI001F3A4716|nr:alpha-1,4-glucan--maltose-1-phosphate maltosyltransferase [Herbaspirillum frisingense]UIN20146.1 alpha-1,4-glucan--maltose-1-phosphate maltosyltransferase [Herbaspirillum frisingense]